MQFVVPIHSKMRTRREALGLSLVRSYNGNNSIGKSRAFSEMGTSDFAERLARDHMSESYEFFRRIAETHIENREENGR